MRSSMRKSKTPRELEAFFHYVNLAVEEVEQLGEHYESGDMFVDEINRRVCEFNAKEELKIMESLGEKLEREKTYQRQEGLREGLKRGEAIGQKRGLQQGREDALLENIQSLMERMKLSLDEAMDVLSVDSEKRAYLIDRLG